MCWQFHIEMVRPRGFPSNIILWFYHSLFVRIYTCKSDLYSIHTWIEFITPCLTSAFTLRLAAWSLRSCPLSPEHGKHHRDQALNPTSATLLSREQKRGSAYSTLPHMWETAMSYTDCGPSHSPAQWFHTCLYRSQPCPYHILKGINHLSS